MLLTWAVCRGMTLFDLRFDGDRLAWRGRLRAGKDPRRGLEFDVTDLQIRAAKFPVVDRRFADAVSDLNLLEFPEEDQPAVDERNILSLAADMRVEYVNISWSLMRAALDVSAVLKDPDGRVHSSCRSVSRYAFENLCGGEPSSLVEDELVYVLSDLHRVRLGRAD